MIIILSIVCGFILLCNIYVLHTMSVSDMLEEFVVEQKYIGCLLANIFYSLAWIIKGIQYLLNKISK